MGLESGEPREFAGYDYGWAPGKTPPHPTPRAHRAEWCRMTTSGLVSCSPSGTRRWAYTSGADSDFLPLPRELMNSPAHMLPPFLSPLPAPGLGLPVVVAC